MEDILEPVTLVDEKNENMYRIKPFAIDTSDERQPAFEAVFPGSYAGEQARLLCRLFQKNGIWHSFSDTDLAAEYGEKFEPNWLVDGPSNGLVHYDKDNVMRVTHSFICKCFLASGKMY